MALCAAEEEVMQYSDSTREMSTAAAVIQKEEVELAVEMAHSCEQLSTRRVAFTHLVSPSEYESLSLDCSTARCVKESLGSKPGPRG